MSQTLCLECGSQMVIPAHYLDREIKCISCQQTFTAYPVDQAYAQWGAKRETTNDQPQESSPPPLPVPSLAALQIYLFVGGEQRGPYTLSQIQSMWRSGSITSDAQYFQQGANEWTPILNIIDQLDSPRPVSPAPFAHPVHTGSYPQSQSQPPLNPGVAAVLSFVVPGLGQIYNGQIAMGIVLLFLTAILYLTIIFGILLHLYLVYDAYTMATKINARKA